MLKEPTRHWQQQLLYEKTSYYPRLRLLEVPMEVTSTPISLVTEYRSPVVSVSKRPVLYNAGYKPAVKTAPAARPVPKTKQLVSPPIKPAQKPATKPIAKAIKPLPPVIEPRDDEVWLSEESRLEETPSVQPTPEGCYELNPIMSRALETELQRIMIEVWKDLPDKPPAGAESLVVECFRNEAGDDLRSALGLNVTKRLLNIYNTLTVRVNFSRKPEPSQVRTFLKATRCVGLKRLTDFSYAARFDTIADFDKVCADKVVACDEIRAHIAPAEYKFTQCPAQLKTIYSDITQRPDEIDKSADNLDFENKDDTTDNKPAEGTKISAEAAAIVKSIPHTNTGKQNENKTANVSKAAVVQSPAVKQVVAKPTVQPKVTQNQTIAKNIAGNAPEKANVKAIPEQKQAIIEAKPKVVQNSEVKKVVAKPTVQPNVTQNQTIAKNISAHSPEKANVKTMTEQKQAIIEAKPIVVQTSEVKKVVAKPTVQPNVTQNQTIAKNTAANAPEDAIKKMPAQNQAIIEAKPKVLQTSEIKKVVAQPTVQPNVTRNQTVATRSATKAPEEAKDKTIPAHNVAKIEAKPKVVQTSEIKKVVAKPIVQPNVTPNQTVAKNSANKAANTENDKTKSTPVPKVETDSKVVKTPEVKKAEVAKPIAQPKLGENQTVAKNAPIKAPTPNTEIGVTKTLLLQNQAKIETKPKVAQAAKIAHKVTENLTVTKNAQTKTPNTDNVKTRPMPVQNKTTPKVESKPKVLKTPEVEKPVAQSNLAGNKSVAKPNTNTEVSKSKAVLGLSTGKQNQDANKAETKPRVPPPKMTVVTKPTVDANKKKSIAKKSPNVRQKTVNKETNYVYFPQNKRKKYEDEDFSDNDELDDEDILALMSGAIVLDQCSGSDDE